MQVLHLIYTHDESEIPLRASVIQQKIPDYSRQFFYRDIKLKLNDIMIAISPGLQELNFRNSKRAIVDLFLYVSQKERQTSGIAKVAQDIAYETFRGAQINQPRNPLKIYLIGQITQLIIDSLCSAKVDFSVEEALIVKEVNHFVERLITQLREW